jgi:uncharacterized protein YjiS (DUF1127 family)
MSGSAKLELPVTVFVILDLIRLSRAVLGDWRENAATRRRLRRCASLDPRFVKDIGLTPCEIVMACRAPPWVKVAREVGETAGKRISGVTR